MSLVALAQQNHRRHGKRGLDSDGSGNENFNYSPSGKARRVLSGARSASGNHSVGPSYVVGPTTIAALRTLFPAMNEQVCVRQTLCPPKHMCVRTSLPRHCLQAYAEKPCIQSTNKTCD